jgi:hypothetical protein
MGVLFGKESALRLVATETTLHRMINHFGHEMFSCDA